MCIVYNKYLTEAGAYPHLPTQPIFFITLKLIQQSKVLHMCFERFLLAFESCDLSQASIFEWQIPKKAIWHFGKIVLFNSSLKSFQA